MYTHIYMESKKTSTPKTRRSISLATIQELEDQPTGDNCFKDKRASMLPSCKAKPEKEILLSEADSSKRPNVIRESPSKDENVSERTTNNVVDGSSGQLAHALRLREDIGKRRDKHEHLSNPDQPNGHPINSAAVDLSRRKSLVEFLRIEEMVSSTVSKHLDKKLAPFFGSSIYVGGYNGSSKCDAIHESYSLKSIVEPEPVLLPKSANDIQERCTGRSNKPHKSTYDYVPTHDRMAALSQKYSKNNLKSVGADHRNQVLPTDAVGKTNSTGNSIDDSNPGDRRLSPPTILEKHHGRLKKKVDLQEVDTQSGTKDAEFTSTPTYTVQINALAANQSIGTRFENTGTNAADYKPAVNHCPAVSCVEGKPLIQYLCSSSSAQTEDHEKTIELTRSVNSEFPENTHAVKIAGKTTIRNECCGKRTEFLQRSPATSSSTSKTNRDQNECYKSITQSESSPTFGTTTVNSENVNSGRNPAIKFIGKTAARNECSKSRTQFIKSNPLQKDTDENVPCKLQTQFSQLGLAVSSKLKKNTIQNVNCDKSPARISENNAVDISGKTTTVQNESCKNKAQFSKTSSVESSKFKKTTDQKACHKSKTRSSKDNRGVKITGKTPVQNQCYDNKTQFPENTPAVKTPVNTNTLQNECRSSYKTGFQRNSTGVAIDQRLGMKSIRGEDSRGDLFQNEVNLGIVNLSSKKGLSYVPTKKYTVSSGKNVRKSELKITLHQGNTDCVDNPCPLQSESSVHGQQYCNNVNNITEHVLQNRKVTLATETQNGIPNTKTIVNCTNEKGMENSALSGNAGKRRQRSLPDLALICKMSSAQKDISQVQVNDNAPVSGSKRQTRSNKRRSSADCLKKVRPNFDLSRNNSIPSKESSNLSEFLKSNHYILTSTSENSSAMDIPTTQAKIYPTESHSSRISQSSNVSPARPPVSHPNSNHNLLISTHEDSSAISVPLTRANDYPAESHSSRSSQNPSVSPSVCHVASDHNLLTSASKKYSTVDSSSIGIPITQAKNYPTESHMSQSSRSPGVSPPPCPPSLNHHVLSSTSGKQPTQDSPTMNTPITRANNYPVESHISRSSRSPTLSSPSRPPVSNHNLLTSTSENYSTQDSPTMNITRANNYPVESHIPQSSRSPNVSPSLSPTSPSNSAEHASLQRNLETPKRSTNVTPEFLEKYRTGLFSDENYTKEKLRMASRKKDSPRNKPVVVTPRSGSFSSGTETPPVHLSPEFTSKTPVVCRDQLKRSVSLNDISTKRPTKDTDRFFKSTSEKIREVSSSLESLIDKVSNISKTALMRHNMSDEERINFSKSGTNFLATLKNRPWKSMDNLSTSVDHCRKPSYLFCKHLETEDNKPNSFIKIVKNIPSQVCSQMSSNQRKRMLHDEIVAERDTKDLEPSVPDTLLHPAKSRPMECAPEGSTRCTLRKDAKDHVGTSGRNGMLGTLGTLRPFEESLSLSKPELLVNERENQMDNEKIKTLGTCGQNEMSGTLEMLRPFEESTRPHKAELLKKELENQIDKERTKNQQRNEMDNEKPNEKAYKTTETFSRNEITGTSGTLRLPKVSLYQTESLGNEPDSEKTNDASYRIPGTSKTTDRFCNRAIKIKTRNDGESKDDKICRNTKNCSRQTNLGNHKCPEVKFSEKLAKPKILEDGVLECSEEGYKEQGHEQSTYRKNSGTKTKQNNQNTIWKPDSTLEKYENVFEESFGKSTFFSVDIQGRNQFFKPCSIDDTQCTSKSNEENVTAPKLEQSCKSSTGEESTTAGKNVGKTKRRRNAIYEAPEGLRARLFSQDDVNRLKMCFLTVQHQNKGLVQESVQQNATDLSEKEKRDESQNPDEDVLHKILEIVHDEFAFDGYLNDGVEDIKMAEFIISRATSSEQALRDAVRKEYKDLYWKDKVIAAMYQTIQANLGSLKKMFSTSQTAKKTHQSSTNEEPLVTKTAPPTEVMKNSIVHSVSRSGSEISNSSCEGCMVSLSDHKLNLPEIISFGLDDIGDMKNDLATIFNDYHRNIGVFLATTVNVLVEKLPVKIKEVQQQINLERKLKRRSWKAYLKLMNNRELGVKESKDMDSKLRRDIEEIEWKIAYLKNVKRKLKNIYAERFGLDGYLLQSFIEQFSPTFTSLHPYIENNYLTFSPLWNQRRGMLGPDDIYESRQGAELQHGSETGLLAYLFARYAMTQGYVKHFLYTYRYCMTSDRLLEFIRAKYIASVSLNDSNEQTIQQLQIQYRSLDLLAEWIDDYFDVDFKHNERLCQELRRFLEQEVITTDKSDRGNLLLHVLVEKGQIIPTYLPLPQNGSVRHGSLDDLGHIELSEHRPGLDENSNKKIRFIGVGRKSLPNEFSDCEAFILDYSDQVLAEQLSLIQQDLFHRAHLVHFLNTRSLGVGVSRNVSPNRIASHKDVLLGFSAGVRRGSGDGFDLVFPETNPTHIEVVNDEIIEDVIEHAQNFSMWVAAEICGMPSIKSQLALVTKLINVANYCQEIRNFETAIQILDALETFVIRQLPVWKLVATKTFEILDHLKAVKVLLKTDASWLIQGDAYRRKPTIPSALLFIMHVQQQELGGFLLANGRYKWAKLRSIARLVDQIHAFKELKYNFLPNEELQRSIKRRITKLKDQNLHLIASENSINFHGQRPSSSSRKLKNALEKMKSSFA